MNDEDNQTSTRMDRKREATSRKIIDTTVDLIRETGYSAVTMEQIAARADIAKGTLYNYYPVKEAIIYDYIDRESNTLNAERIQRMRRLPDTRARMRVSLTELVEGVKQRSEIFEVFFTYRVQQMVSLSRADSRTSGLHALESEILRLGQEAGEIRTDMPLEILEGLYEFVFVVVVQQFYNHPTDFNPQQVIDHCIDLFMNGVKPAKE